MTGLSSDLGGGTYDFSEAYSYNPAAQIVGMTSTNAAYNYASPSGYTDSYTANGLNRYTSARGITPTYTDSRGNMTHDGSKTYSYDYSNRLISASGSPGATLSYDPIGRLYEVAGSSTVRFLYDGRCGGAGCRRESPTPLRDSNNTLDRLTMTAIIIPQSTLTCPSCGHRETRTMPTNACQWFYTCADCGVTLQPKAGDCCVFCSFGDVKCPPIQAGGCCGSSA